MKHRISRFVRFACSAGICVLFCSVLVFNCCAGNAVKRRMGTASAELNHNISWAPPTNGIKAGIYCERNSIQVTSSSRSEMSSDWRLIPAVAGTSPHSVLLWLAPRKQWKLELIGPSGDRVRMTDLGKRQGDILKVGKHGFQASGFIPVRADSQLPTLVGRGFLISDMFEIRQPGKYELRITLCGFIVADGKIYAVHFPLIDRKLEFD
jgi:hypothetical protein